MFSIDKHSQTKACVQIGLLKCCASPEESISFTPNRSAAMAK